MKGTIVIRDVSGDTLRVPEMRGDQWNQVEASVRSGGLLSFTITIGANGEPIHRQVQYGPGTVVRAEFIRD